MFRGKQTSRNFLFLTVALTQSVHKTGKCADVTVTHQCSQLLILFETSGFIMHKQAVGLGSEGVN